jgi:alpha-tubulin suppressor-like RCC1 family protein
MLSKRWLGPVAASPVAVVMAPARAAGRSGGRRVFRLLLPSLAVALFVNVLPGVAQAAVAAPQGSVMAWGYNGGGELGDGTTISRTSPVAVSGLSSGVVAVAGGRLHSLALKSDGSVWAWGYNLQGQLGDGTTINRTSPVAVSGLSSGVVAVAGGSGDHSLALKADGSVWSWGYNSQGQLGDGTTINRTSPVAVSGLSSGVVAVAGGGYHSLALKADGSVWAWGDNFSGQLGDGTGLNRTSPVAVSGLSSGVVAVAGGGVHSLALKSDGSVVAWGFNAQGELGDGTTTNRFSPVAVSGLSSGVVAVAGGGSHSLALKADGFVWSWGYNAEGELGDGTTINRTSPVAVSGLSSGVVAVAGGGSHSLALKADGSVWAWGDNSFGQLGDGTTINRTSPVAVSGLSGVLAVAGGGGHSLAAVTPAALVSIALTPTNPVLEPSGTQQFTATGTYSDSTTADLTRLVTWSSGTPAVASFLSYAGGLATALANGTSTITASLNGVSGTTLLTVHSLTAIVVTPANPGSAPGGTLYFTATGTYSDSTTADLTGLVTWSSGTPAVASISSGGLATALANGTSTITASLGPVSGTTLFTVLSLTGIVVTPVNPVLALGGTQQFKATGTYSDGTTTDLTCSWGVIWSSSTPAVASIDNCGLATALANGTSSITASWFKPGPTSGTTLLTVGDTDLGLTGVPANVTVNVTGPLGAVVTYAAPTAIDEAGDSLAPTVSCTPGSGSTFVTGTTTVTCTATSADDSPSTVSGTFTVTVVASPAGISNVVGQFLAAGSINNSGIASALSAKLTAAQNAIAAGNLKTAINILSAFIDQAQAQNGKHILAASTLNGVTFSPSAVLIADARSLIDSLTATTVPNPITGTVVTSTGAAAPGATVSLVDSNGAIVATATSDVTGFYFFATTGLLSTGVTYSVSVTGFPAGFTSSSPQVQTFTWVGSSISFSNFTLT